MVVMTQRQCLVETAVDHHPQPGRVIWIRADLNESHVEVIHDIGSDKVVESWQRGSRASVSFKRGPEVGFVSRTIDPGGLPRHGAKVNLRPEARDGLDNILGNEVRGVA